MGIWETLGGKSMADEQRDDARMERLDELTIVARRGLAAYAETGRALAEIKADELWRLVAPTWAEWCRQTLDLTDRRVDQIISAAKTYDHISEAGLTPPSNERVARQLSGLDDTEQVDAWRELLEDDDQPNSAKVERAVSKRKKTKRKTGTPKPVSLRVPGAAVRIVPRKSGWSGLVATLEHALNVAKEREAQQAGDQAKAA